MKGKENSFKDVTVRRQNVADALQWLVNNNSHYKDITINQNSLNSLPEHGVPHGLLSVETENIDLDATCEPDLGPQNEDDIVYNEGTEMSSFLPIPECQQQEIEAVRQQLSNDSNHLPWPTVGSEPLNDNNSPCWSSNILFFTFSSADMHWPELHAIFGNSVSNNSTDNKRQNVINNPHITDWFFTQRLESFIKYWLYNSLDAEWHWYRFEYQARGSIHCHGVAKLKNDPGLCKLSETALKGYLAEMSTNTAEQVNILELNQQIVDGKKASQVVCQYVDWLLSTYNPDPPDNGTWVKPSIHPCQKRHKDLVSLQDSEQDYVDLLNTVQRHTRCSTNYCLRKKQNETELKCRFKFPFEPCVNTKLEFEPIHTKDGSTQYKAKIITKRNDSRLNNHQRLQLQGWRANCDIQVIIDYHACVEYLAKYASKGEPKSPVMKLAFNSIVRNCNNNSNPTKLIKK
ncbi:unnamed protein product [Porites lobata]|uniref:Helitron helicase-like domain-containing protein n=1 Tax=Porites lobata TaxID=104759 RepID=A0ABN8NV68_9CNID|nr:unnamed protein product [Porites lobata]